MEDITSCEYWRRLWIVQEVVLAREILIGLGDKFFPWKYLESIAETVALSTRMQQMEQMDSTRSTINAHTEWMALVEQRSQWRKKVDNTVTLKSLMSLIQQFSRQRCTNVRDKVIGLLGLASADVTHLADYSLPLEDFFSAVCQHVFAESSMTIEASQ